MQSSRFRSCSELRCSLQFGTACNASRSDDRATRRVTLSSGGEWYNITDPASPELDQLAERYHLHPLHIEDCRHRNQSAKIEEGEGYLFAVLKVMRLMDDGSIHAADLDVFFGLNFVITVEEETCPEIKSIIQQVRQTPSAPQRSDQVFSRIMDHVVDSYLPILDHFDDLIDALEDEALENPTPDTLSRIFQNKRALAILRRVLVNTRDVPVTCRERSRRTSRAICGRSFATSTITWRAISTSSR